LPLEKFTCRRQQGTPLFLWGAAILAWLLLWTRSNLDHTVVCLRQNRGGGNLVGSHPALRAWAHGAHACGRMLAICLQNAEQHALAVLSFADSSKAQFHSSIGKMQKCNYDTQNDNDSI